MASGLEVSTFLYSSTIYVAFERARRTQVLCVCTCELLWGFRRGKTGWTCGEKWGDDKVGEDRTGYEVKAENEQYMSVGATQHIDKSYAE